MRALKFLTFLHNDHDAGIFREIPIEANGNIFASPMPFGAYDPRNRLIKLYKEKKIDHVYSLVTDEELKNKARRDIFKKYGQANISFSRHVIQDFQAPSLEILDELVQDAIKRLQNQRVVVHCHAGVGRTAVATSCIVMAMNKVPAEEAIEHIKHNMTINITTEQKSIIKKYESFRREKSA